MPDEVTFLDLACLLRIGQDTTLEKLGSAINASIFDASNIAGALKQKGLIDFTAYYPGPNTITITDAGKALISEGEGKSGESFDNLDEEILKQLSGGKRVPIEMQTTLNLRPKDLALRIYKLYKQGFVIFELKSGGADIMLTEAGFLKSKASPTSINLDKPKAPEPQPQPMASSQAQEYTNSMNPYGANNPGIKPEMPRAAKKGNAILYVALLIVIILVVVGALYHFNYITLG